MYRRSSHGRHWLAVILSALVIATGTPWSEIHAHEHDDGSAHGDDSLPSHVERHHHDGQPADDQHIHDHGLLTHCPGAVPAADTFVGQIAASGAFPDPALLHLQSPSSPPLRPPARP
jgi:hypothetical protein